MKEKQITWLLIFDSNTCRIYEYMKDGISLIKEIQHPENKLRDIEITSDKPGHYRAMGGQVHGAYVQETDPKEILIENFSREIAEILEHNNAIHAYQRLILASSPHMKGLLLKHLNKQVEKLIVYNSDKNLLHLTDSQVFDYLKEELKFGSN